VKAALATLEAIYLRLKGDPSVLPAARANLLLAPLLCDPASGTLISLDGPEHFTSHRLAALELYPGDAPLGFDHAEHLALCRELAPQSDRVDRGLAAKGFGFGGVPRERAYHDALRDLAVPAMGHPPLVRITVLDGDREGAYAAWDRARRSPRR
jgi:hypothetical protein